MTLLLIILTIGIITLCFCTVAAEESRRKTVREIKRFYRNRPLSAHDYLMNSNDDIFIPDWQTAKK